MNRSPAGNEAMMPCVNFLSKWHRATVTQADSPYEGTLTIDKRLLKTADILPHTEAAIWTVTGDTAAGLVPSRASRIPAS
jgi:aspartokinase-like uncharacterized kinase